MHPSSVPHLAVPLIGGHHCSHRSYACFPLICPRCHNPMRLLAFITEPATIRHILTHLAEPSTPPPISPARGPPLDASELDQSPAWDPAGPQPDPGFQFDQSRSG